MRLRIFYYPKNDTMLDLNVKKYATKLNYILNKRTHLNVNF